MRIKRAAQSKFPGPLDVRAGGKALRGMMRTLRNGGLLYILMDQAARSGGEKAELPGQRLNMPDGAALSARRCRVPVIPPPMVAADPVWKFELQPPVFPESLGRDCSDHQHLARQTEGQIRRNPELWSWQQRR